MRIVLPRNGMDEIWAKVTMDKCGGSSEDFIALQTAAREAMEYMEKAKR